MEVKLVVLTGKQKNREIPLPRTIFLIGRGKECHLRVHSALVSRRQSPLRGKSVPCSRQPSATCGWRS